MGLLVPRMTVKVLLAEDEAVDCVVALCINEREVCALNEGTVEREGEWLEDKVTPD